ncbi:contact-dependent growth inhibition system immunity protein [Achromobacter seleniivolatilans]|uniref:Contact-dependent growth inhibition system immunity protein n=1 Tax=Achromobacter seleniivolatilans TaxID=3047478 RepID=A0ABY9M8D4_9BURK|nr:contact-dependent growth inhibition system immunity protein [Achromobacter sp. R39]WMD22950.1 contact-dependent growth inhibition system immunity protein [Achromobacter sp. R39]
MMVDLEQYPALNNLLAGYFHEDYDLFGETIEEVVLAYKQVSTSEEVAQVCCEMEKFVVEFGSSAAAAYAEHWGSFNPAGGGYTISAFFDALKRVLNS